MACVITKITDKQTEIQIYNSQNRHKHLNLHTHAINQLNRSVISGDMLPLQPLHSLFNEQNAY